MNFKTYDSTAGTINELVRNSIMIMEKFVFVRFKLCKIVIYLFSFSSKSFSKLSVYNISTPLVGLASGGD